MSILTHRHAPVPTPRTSRTPASADSAVQHATDAEVYALLAEAAHLVSQAGRELRAAQQTQRGFALQTVVDEIHEEIRRLPASARNRKPSGRPQARRRFEPAHR